MEINYNAIFQVVYDVLVAFEVAQQESEQRIMQRLDLITQRLDVIALRRAQTAMSRYPTADDVRAALIERMDAYCKKTGIAASSVCASAFNDTTFFRKVVDGRNFTIGQYQRMIDFIDAHPNGPPKRKRTGP
jgi:hypothetical protein